MSPFALTFKSLRHRKFTVSLTVISLALGVALLLGVQRARHQARTSFTNTISGTDLIVGGRTGQVSLLLSSVFRIGNPTQNISWETYEKIASNPQVAWTIPLSLGDSHRGYRVLGTTHDYFEHYRYANRRKLELAEGEVFDETYDAVLGAEVAGKLGYAIGDEIVLAHGAGDVSFVEHADKPFHVVGILEATGTPVDQTVHVSLEGIEAVHEGWDGHGGHACHGHAGHHHPTPPVKNDSREGQGHETVAHAEHEHCEHGHCEHEEHEHCEHHQEITTRSVSEDHSASNAESSLAYASGYEDGTRPASESDVAVIAGGPPGGAGGMDRLAAFEAMLAGDDEDHLQPTQITAFLLGMHSRADAVFLQRSINTYDGEPLSAVMPGVALQELWQVVGVVEKTLLVISIFVVAVSLVGMLSTLMTSLNERRREMAILRSVGARPFHIVALITGEAVAVTALAIVLGIAILYTLLAVARPIILDAAGLRLDFSLFSSVEVLVMGLVLAVGLLVGLLPAWRCYRQSLADGLTIKV